MFYTCIYIYTIYRSIVIVLLHTYIISDMIRSLLLLLFFFFLSDICGVYMSCGRVSASSTTKAEAAVEMRRHRETRRRDDVSVASRQRSANGNT